MIQKQIALLVALTTAALLIISHLDLGNETDTSSDAVTVDSQSNTAVVSNDVISDTGAWALTDIRTNGSSFGETDSTSPTNITSLGGTNLTPSSTTATSSPLRY